MDFESVIRISVLLSVGRIDIHIRVWEWARKYRKRYLSSGSGFQLWLTVNWMSECLNARVSCQRAEGKCWLRRRKELGNYLKAPICAWFEYKKRYFARHSPWQSHVMAFSRPSMIRTSVCTHNLSTLMDQFLHNATRLHVIINAIGAKFHPCPLACFLNALCLCPRENQSTKLHCGNFIVVLVSLWFQVSFSVSFLFH